MPSMAQRRFRPSFSTHWRIDGRYDQCRHPRDGPSKPWESVQVIAGLRCAGNAPDARRRADGHAGEDQSPRPENAVEAGPKTCRTERVIVVDLAGLRGFFGML